MIRRVLHVLSTPRAEGTPNLVLDWLRAGNGLWQSVAVLNSQPADLTDQLRANADAYEEHHLYGLGYRKFVMISRVAYGAVRKHRPDVVICWPTGFANWVCVGAALAGARRLLVHCGNPPRRGWKGDWMTRYGIWPLALVGAKCVCCSEFVRGEFQSIRAIPRTLFHAVWNCSRGPEMAALVDDGSFRRNGSKRRAIMVATLERHKDHGTLLRAVPTIVSRLPDFELWLVGDGSLRSDIEKTICQLGVGKQVVLLGRRTDVGSLLGQADVFVLATTSQEGFGSVLIEAMAAGLPIVASDVPACDEVLHGGRFGKLVPPGDASALADAVISTLSCKNSANQAARDFALSLTPERMMREYLALVQPRLRDA